MALDGQPATLCFVLILRFRNRRHYPVYYRPAPIPDMERDAWRFVPGMLQGDGYVDVKDAMAAALLLGRQLNSLRHALLNQQLECPAENIVIDMVVDVPFMPAVIVFPPFGRGRRSLKELLELGARKIEKKDQRLIVLPRES